MMASMADLEASAALDQLNALVDAFTKETGYANSDEVEKMKNSNNEKTTPIEISPIEEDTKYEKIHERIPVHSPAVSEENTLYLCPICAVSFDQPDTLDLHMVMHQMGEVTENPNDEPDGAEPNGDIRKILDDQMSVFDGNPPDQFVGTSINDVFKQEKVLKFNKKNIYACLYCDAVFPKAGLLKQHVVIHNGGKPHACLYCDMRFDRQDKLIRHTRTHTGEKPYGCTLCEKRFSRGDKLKIHIKKHGEENAYPCTMCEDKFNSAFQLERHVKSHLKPQPAAKIKVPRSPPVSFPKDPKDPKEPRSPKPPPVAFPCTMCDKVFFMVSEFKRHLKDHTGGKPHKCPQCDLRFVSAGRLSVHMRGHTGERPYPCPQCNQAFSYSSNLRRHLRKHTGEKPYECLLCDKRFSRGDKLTEHIRDYHPDRPNGEVTLCPTNESLSEKKHDENKHNENKHDQDMYDQDMHDEDMHDEDQDENMHDEDQDEDQDEHRDEHRDENRDENEHEKNTPETHAINVNQ